MSALEDLLARRLANLDDIVHVMAEARGHDLSEGLAPDLKSQLEAEAEHAYEQWGEDQAVGAEPSATPVDLQTLFAARREIDRRIVEHSAAGREAS
jgi:5'-deoxynucleotidase YfbR-like HD superfamily hydrolase